MKKMKKECAIVVAAVILLSVLMVLPVISGGENVTNASDMGGSLLSELSEAPTSGSWVGTTSEGEAVSFNVSDTEVYNFTIRYSYSCLSGAHGRERIKLTWPPFDILENKFQYNSDEQTIYGEFTSPNSATGTYSSTWTEHFPYEDTCYTGDITWSATFQTPTPTPTLTQIEVTPSTKTLDAGETQQFTATAYDQYDDVMSNIDIVWTSSNTAVGTVSPASATTGSNGKATTTFTASASGTTTVKAAHGTVSGTASVTVGNNGDSGCKIAFNSDRDGDNEIYVMDADGTNVKKLTSNSADDEYPTWSPNCKKIGFESDRDGDWEIYVMDADGTNVKKLTSNTVGDGGSAWSPDGGKIAFHSGRGGDYEIYVMDVDGTNVKKLTSNPANDGFPDWSPDGSKIVFWSERDGDREIYVMNGDGTNVKQLTSNYFADDAPAWSPDGSKIAFESDRDGNFEIYVMDTDGTNVKRLTSNTADDGESVWSPDGSKIVFSSMRDGDAEIYVMVADGTNVKKLTSNTAWDSGPDWCCSGPSGQLLPIFDTGDSSNPYPSIFGTHNGTLTPDQTITVHKLYTYPCSGTGGHSEYVKIWNEAWDGVEAYWKGYQEDRHNIIFDPPFTLEAGTTYNYTIVTGSYPQIIHESSKEVTGGRITCTEFTDTNGHSYNNWIPAIRLEGYA